MHRTRIAIIGAGKRGSLIYNELKMIKAVVIIGVADCNPMAPGMLAAREDKVFVTTNFCELVNFPSLDLIIEATGVKEVRRRLYQVKHDYSGVIDAQSANLLVSLLKEREELLKYKRIQEELSAILNSVQEGIEVADSKGIIKYVNPAFCQLTGITAKDRIGQNIFGASPNGALAASLRSGKKVIGHRTKVGGSNAEVVSNAYPIIIDGNMEGAVVVFQHFTDVMRLVDELRKSTSIIEDLSDKFGQVATSKYTFDHILGNSSELKKCIQLAEKAARSNSTVFLLGESGTGKEIFAHAIHHASLRRDKPFIKVNCAAIPETLLESEFFGYVKGAFTGAIKSKIGKFELAHGGTIFLDEIGDMSLILQAKLLRVLQEMEFERLGGNQVIKVDVRVIAATNRNVQELIKQGKFREDFYYRLNVVEITIPPLRFRKEDLPVIANDLIVKLNRKLGKKIKGMDESAEEVLFGYDWPGNVRELENVIERAMVTADEDVIAKKHLIQYVQQFKSSSKKDFELIPINQVEELLIKKALTKFGNSVEGKRRAAQVLNISLATLYNKLKKSSSKVYNN